MYKLSLAFQKQGLTSSQATDFVLAFYFHKPVACDNKLPVLITCKNEQNQRNSWYWINLIIIINFCKDCTSWFVCEVRQYTAWQVIHVSRITVPTHLKTIINWSCTYINKFESPAVPIGWYSEHVLNLTSEHVTRCTRSEAADERVR